MSLNNNSTYPATTTTGTGHNVLRHNQPVANTQQAAYTNPGAGSVPHSTAQGGYADPASNSINPGTTAGTGLTGGNLGHHHAKHGPTTGTVTGATTGPHSSTGSGGAAMKSAVGQMEHAAGSLLCSQNLKTKGIMKEQEAAAQRQQNAHLNRAEMIEQQAVRERGMAVGAGAHPDQGHLGGSGVGGGVAGGRAGVY